MTTTRRRMVIAVNPRVLGDALSRVLARDDVDIALLPEGAELPDDRAASQYHLAIVSDALPEEVSANVVIRLPEASDVGDEPVDLPGLLHRVEAALGDPID